MYFICNINAINIYINPLLFNSKVTYHQLMLCCFCVSVSAEESRSHQFPSAAAAFTDHTESSSNTAQLLKMFYSSCRRFNADTFNDIFTTAVFYTHVRTMSICDLQPSLMVWRLSTLHSENWDIWQGPDRFEVLLSSSSSLRSWNEIAAKSNIYKQSSWITTLFGQM